MGHCMMSKTCDWFVHVVGEDPRTTLNSVEPLLYIPFPVLMEWIRILENVWLFLISSAKVSRGWEKVENYRAAAQKDPDPGPLDVHLKSRHGAPSPDEW